MGFEPMNTGFADRRVNHFAIGAYPAELPSSTLKVKPTRHGSQRVGLGLAQKIRFTPQTAHPRDNSSGRS
jgi:hypothetical protein